MAQTKTKTCQMCRTSFKARRDAKTCSATCRKRLQRALQSKIKTISVVDSKIKDELHRLAGSLISSHVVFEPIPISDERGSIQALPIKVENKTDDEAKIEMHQPGQIYQPIEANTAQTDEEFNPAPSPSQEAPNDFSDTLPVVAQAQPGTSTTTVEPSPVDTTVASQLQELEGTEYYPATPVRSIWSETLSKFRHRWVLLAAIIFLVLFPLGGGFLFLNSQGDNQNDNGSNNGPLAFSSAGIGSSNIKKGDKFSVNLILEAKNTLIISPTEKPQNLEKGQIFLDQDSNKLLFYDGKELHDLGASSTIINNIQGPTNITNSTIINSSVGPGVTSLSGTVDQINVSSSTGDVTLSLPQSIATSSSPTFAGLNLGSALQVASGGTGRTSFAANSLLIGNGAGALQATNVGTAGQCLVVNGSGVPTFQSCPGAGGISAGASQTSGYLTKFDTTTDQIVDSLASESGSTLTINGDLAITGIANGDGSGLTDLNAANISSGILDDSHLSANVTRQGNTFNGANELVKLTAGGLLPVLNGSNLTNVDALTLQGNGASYYTNASNISSGMLNDSRLSPNVALYNAATANFTGLLQQGGNEVCTVAGNCAGVGGVGDILNNGNSFGSAVTLGTNDNFGLNLEVNGATVASFSNTGEALFKSASDSAAAFQIQNHDGTSNLFVADTANNRVGIGTLGPGYRLDVQGGDINTSGIYRVNGAQISSADLSNDSNLAKINGANVFTAANTFSSTVAIQGANSLTLGTNSNVGSITFHDGASANVATLQVAGALSGNVNFALPTATGSQTICTVETGNCAGSGTGITGSGTTNKLAKFTGGQAIGDSSISDDSTTVTVAADQVIQGSGGLTIGASGVNGKLVFKNSSNSNTLTLQSGVTSGDIAFTLPTADGSNGNCLKTNGSGVLTFASCTGGAGGGVTSVNTLTGVLDIVGTANQINVSSAGNTITLSLPQDINTSGNATFRTITLNGQATGDNLIIANAVSGATGNLIDLKVDGTSKFTVSPNGDVNTTGQYQINGTQISSADLSNDSNLAKLNGTGPQTFTGNNKFTGTVLTQLDSATAFQIQNSTATSNLFVADTTTSRIGIGTALPGYTLDVNGDINTTGVYRVNGVTVCSASGCTPASGSGDYIQNGTVPQTADFNITGAGTIGGLLTVGGNASIAGTITANAGGGVPITVGSNCTATNNAICFGDGINLYNYDNGTSLATDGLLQSANLYTTGSLNFGTFHMTSFTTPTGANVDTKINIPLFDPGAFSQLIALGLPNGSATSARAITVFDARTTTNNQPALAVISPNESNIFGLSWEGANTTGYLKVGGGGSIGLRSGSNDLALFNSGGAATFKTSSGVTNAFQLISSNQTYLQADSQNYRLGVGLNAAPANSVLTVGTNTTAASGGITFGTDTNLYRSGNNTLKTDDALTVGQDLTVQGNQLAFGSGATLIADGGINSLKLQGARLFFVGSSTTDPAYCSAINTDNDCRFQMRTDGLLEWGQGTAAVDTNLYRGSAGQLNTDGSLFVNNNIGVGGTINVQGSALTTSSTTFDLLNTTATTLNIGGATTALNLAGGSGSTGCTIDGSGNLSCSGDITSGSTSGTQGWWTRTGNYLEPANLGDNIQTTNAVSGSTISLITSSNAAYVSNVSSSDSDWALATQVSGDANRRFVTYSDGYMEWGNGTNTTDTNLYRIAPGTLATDSLFQARGQGIYLTDGYLVQNEATAATDTFLQSRVNADATVRYRVNTDGETQWGDGTNGFDTNLYRSAADVLRTDSSFYAGNNLTVDDTLFVNGSAINGGSNGLSIIAGGTDQDLTLDASGAGQINIGGTSTGNIVLGGGSGSTGCTLTNSTGDFYCAGTIKAVNNLQSVGGSIQALDGNIVSTRAGTGNNAFVAQVSGESQVRYQVNADGKIQWGDGTNALDTNLYRSAANVLKTDDTLVSAVALQAPSIDTASASALNIGTTTQNALNIGRSGANTTVTGGNVFLSGNTSVLSGSTFSVQSGYASITGLSTGSNTTLRVNNHTSTGSILVLQDAATDVFTVADGGAVTAKNDSTTAFRVQNANGTDHLFTVDTINGKVGIGADPSASGATLQVDGDLSVALGPQTITTDTPGGGIGWVFTSQGGEVTAVHQTDSFGGGLGFCVSTTGTLCAYGTDQVRIAGGGATTFQNSGDSDNAFQIQNSSDNTLFNVNTNTGQSNFYGGGSTIATFDYEDGSDPNQQANIAFQGDRAEVGYDGSIQSAYLRAGTDKGLELQVQDGSVTALTIGTHGAATFQNGTDSTTAFQILQATTNASLFNADTSGMNITMQGDYNGATSTWASTVSTGLPAREGNSSVIANGYIYLFAGYNSGAQSGVYYSKLNANGTTNAWTSTTALPAALDGSRSIFSNGYIYVLSGSGGSRNVYYTKPSADGTISAWSTLSTVLPSAQRNTAAVAANNGYIYWIGGDNGSATSAVSYAKQNPDGSLGTFTTTSSLPGPRTGIQAVVANGYVYIFGGYDDNGIAQTAVYKAQINASGTLGSWSATGLAALPSARHQYAASAVNGYVYIMGGIQANSLNGSATNTVFYAHINANGTISSWTTSSKTLPDNLRWVYGGAANGYIYTVDGDNGSPTSAVYYSSVSRVQIAGSLDLVGINGGNLANPGTGGTLTAGDTDIVGTLQVKGAANFSQGVGISGNLNVSNDTTIKSSSTTAFQIQDSSNNLLFVADTTNSRIYVGNPTADSTGALLVLDNKNTVGDPTAVPGGMYYNSATNSFRCYQNSVWQSCGPQTKEITSDVSSTSTSYSDVTGMTFSLAANTDYTVSCTVNYTSSSTTTGISLAFNGPASPTYVVGDWVGYDNSINSYQGIYFRSYNSNPATTGVDTINSPVPSYIKATIRNGANSGTLALRLASEVGGSSVVVKAGSNCSLTQL